MFKKKIYLFDLDGVLIDSKKNMEMSWIEVNQKYNLGISFESYFKNIGLPFLKILEILKIKKELYKKISKEYKLNSEKNINYVKLFNGVKKVLGILKKKNKVIGVLTSKEKSRTVKILNKFNLKFDEVMCPKNNFHGKPNPKQILTFLKKKNCSRNEIVYIGDMKVDKLTAKNAKIDYIHASYGYSKKINNRYSINKIDEIITKKFGLN